VERFFGTCEYFYQLQHILGEACAYEAQMGRITLRTKPENLDGKQPYYFDHLDPETCSPLYIDAIGKKGHFVLRMMEKRLPKEQFIKVKRIIVGIFSFFWHNFVGFTTNPQHCNATLPKFESPS
jgi:hypothetical protein